MQEIPTYACLSPKREFTIRGLWYVENLRIFEQSSLRFLPLKNKLEKILFCGFSGPVDSPKAKWLQPLGACFTLSTHNWSYNISGMILPPDRYSEGLNILFCTQANKSGGLTCSTSLNLHVVFIVALVYKVKVCKNSTGWVQTLSLFCLGKCLTCCLSETKCGSFQGGAVSGYKKIRASIVLNAS